VQVALDGSVINAENIAKDVVMLGITGTHEGSGGSSFVTSTLPNNDHWVTVTYGNGKFVALRGGGLDAAYSTDGLTW